MGSTRTVAVASLVLAACNRAPTVADRVTTPLPAVFAEAAPAHLPEAGSLAPRDAGQAPAPAPRAPRACSVDGPADTVDDGGGKADEYGTTRLENLRVLVDAGVTIVTFERQSDFQIGDSWRAPVLASREGTAPFKWRAMPVRAYACATSGYAAPLGEAERFVTWGVENATAFQVWRREPEVGMSGAVETVKTKPSRSRATSKQSVSKLVVSRDVALATTFDHTCEAICSCAGTSTPGLWVYSLASTGAKPTKIATPASSEYNVASALAMGDEGGVGAFRSRGGIRLFWLDAAGVPTGAPVEIARGDVGAPAVAIAGRKAVVAWARRGAKSEPYTVSWVAIDHGTTSLPEPRTLAATASAFAPAVTTDGVDAVFAWMQGDSGGKGAVLAARVALDGSAAGPALAVSSPDEKNARDPEISGPLDAPVVAYGAFSKSRPGGVARVVRLSCAR